MCGCYPIFLIGPNDSKWCKWILIYCMIYILTFVLCAVCIFTYVYTHYMYMYMYVYRDVQSVTLW